jgi:hypothetical protein
LMTMGKRIHFFPSWLVNNVWRWVEVKGKIAIHYVASFSTTIPYHSQIYFHSLCSAWSFAFILCEPYPRLPRNNWFMFFM